LAISQSAISNVRTTVVLQLCL